MPEKVLLKFGDDADETPKVVQKARALDTKSTNQKQAQSKSKLKSQPQSHSTKSTGTKRLRDGSPKSDSKRKKLAVVQEKVTNATL